MDACVVFWFRSGVTGSDARNCTITWTKSPKTTYVYNVYAQARSLDECKEACIKNGSCTGINYSHHIERLQRKYPPYRRRKLWMEPNGKEIARYLRNVEQCTIVGPWSGRRIKGNTTHYELIRKCTGGQRRLCYYWKQVAQLSQRDRAAEWVSYMAKSGRLELGDNIWRTL